MKLYTSLFLLFITITSLAQKKSNDDSYFLKSSHLNTLKFRNVGPALTAGRIADIAVNPSNHSEYYLAVASGGVWKTTNAGTTYEPIFDGQSSYSIGCITIDPSNEHILWVGSGENNNQRSVAYGDGIYKSEDGGKSWKNMGLIESEHIHKIIVHPNNSNIIYVAAAGPLWKEGGERGIYKSEDGGETWKRIHHISENTGATDLVMDPRDPNVMYTAFHQRRRHVFTYLGGGPESALLKTTDGGKTWKKIHSGLPGVDLGRIGLAISPANPDVVYAIVEAAQGKGGFFKSTDRGASWSKMSGYATSGNYYQEIVCHPTDVNTVYSMNTWLHHTEDGGKTFNQTGEKHKHVDNHCMWIDPTDHNHWLVGCDGGLYETWDAAENWHYKPNLPITQFYKVAVDNSEPFYYIYGGTQDNNSLGGPSRTVNNAGILNSDWFITNGGDGFESAIDPVDPNIVYAQAQYGWLVRYDKKSGERLAIQPQPGKDEPGLRWNWDAPLLVSPHDHKRIYFAANKVFRSDDRGDTWTAISEDLTRQLDRNKMKVMGRVWGIDAVMKNRSTTIFGNIVALDESPLKEGLIYAGTDDGLIQVTEDGGKTWTRYSSFPGIPDMTYVNMLVASKHDENTVFAVFNNHKRGDFNPYILKSTDKGKSWSPIHNSLPKRGSVYAVAQDHVQKNLLFAGTEFGCFTSIDGGKKWIQLSAGLPTIAVRDMDIQKRENDLVLATMGRGFYVLDDYTPLREMSKELLDKQAYIFSIKEALLYVETNPLGLSGVGSQGESMYAAANPEFGATFTFYLKDGIKTIQDKRRDKESEVKKDGGDVFYPTFNEMRKEKDEDEPFLLFIIRDDVGQEVKRIKSSASSGMKRINWNLRHSTTTPVKLKHSSPGRYGMADDGFLALPGTYSVQVYSSTDGVLSKLTDPKNFTVRKLNNVTLPAEDIDALQDFYKEVSELRRRIRGTGKLMGELSDRIDHIKAAVIDVPGVPMDILKEAKALDQKLTDMNREMWGDEVLSEHQFEVPEGFANRVETIVWTMWNSSSKPTTTSINGLKIAEESYEAFYPKVHDVLAKVKTLEIKLNEAKSNYTPGRGIDWKEE